jgi:salicylate synthase
VPTATVTVPVNRSPLDTAVMLARYGPYDRYLIYETPGSWIDYLAGTASELSVFGDHIERRQNGRSTSVAWRDDPLPVVHAMLGEAPLRGRGAYGWAAFELGYALSGQGTPGPPARQPLMRLVAPVARVRIWPGRAEVFCDDPGGAERIGQVLTGTRGEPGPASPVTVDIDSGRKAYESAVASAVATIRSGRLRKVILSRAIEVAHEIDLPATFAAARRANAPARSFLLRLDGLEAAGVSPELVAEVRDDGSVRTQPLAGTRAITGDAETDQLLREQLLNDPKEVYEHAVSVQIAWQEMTRICAPGTVRVEQLMTVAERGTVQHLASCLAGRLADNAAGPWAVMGALFPGVTASGVPKTTAYEIIRAHEPEPRGLYGGVVLMCAPEGGLEATLALRTVFRSGRRTWLRAGAGIVADSDPRRELEETSHKLRSISRHLIPARPAGANRGADGLAGPRWAG